MPDEEVGEVKGADFIACGERVVAFEKAVAMRACHHADPQPVAGRLKLPAGAAIGIDDEDRSIGVPVPRDRGFDQGRNSVGVVVQDRWQALQVEVVPAIGGFEGQYLMCQRPAGQKQHLSPASGGQSLLGQGCIVWAGGVRAHRRRTAVP